MEQYWQIYGKPSVHMSESTAVTKGLNPLGSPEYTSVLVPTLCAPTFIANVPIVPDRPSNYSESVQPYKEINIGKHLLTFLDGTLVAAVVDCTFPDQIQYKSWSQH